MFQKINNFFTSKKNTNLIKEISNKYLNQVNQFEDNISNLTKEEMISQILTLKNNYSTNDLNELSDKDISFICALVREVSQRTIELRHYDSQIIGGIALYHGFVAEMKTGEGKTLVATIPIILNFVLDKKVHLITVNDYLAKRDCLWMGPIFDYLNISCSYIQNDQSIEEKISRYQSHVIYGNNNEFCFDYLRDNLRTTNQPKMQKDYHVAIIDEADSVLIDESRSPLGISGPVKTPLQLFKLCYEITQDLSKSDVEINEERKNVLLIDSGIKKIEFNLKKINFLKGNSLFDNENLEAYQIINQSLKARFLYERDKDYVIS